MKFFPLGGAGEIGASCFYLNFKEAGIILDCGTHPKKNGIDALSKFELIKNLPVDYVLISHAHQDHLSALPFLIKNHPYIKIITTPQTRALAELTLHNSVSILKEQLTEEDELKIYSHDEVDLLIQSIDYKAYKEKFNVTGFNQKNKVTATFYDAGHILGSAGILIEYENKKIYYTGDINLDNQAIIKGAELPKAKVDTLIIETTYGATDSSTILPREKEASRLASSINKIFNKGGSVLIPVFSLGKMQEMLKTIWDLMHKNILASADIYIGGIGTKINRVYDYNRYVVNMIDPEFELNSIPVKNLYDVINFNDFFKTPSIVLASSGMMIKGTASYRLAKRWIDQENSAIYTVGFMEEATPGYKIANAAKNEKIKFSDYDVEKEIKCEIKQFRFTAHSKRESLLKIVDQLKPKNVILVHGDQSAIDWMGSKILKKNKSLKVYQAEVGKEIILN